MAKLLPIACTDAFFRYLLRIIEKLPRIDILPFAQAVNLFTVVETELLEMIENGEKSGVDFKLYVLANCWRAKALSFSNLEDGMLFWSEFWRVTSTLGISVRIVSVRSAQSMPSGVLG